VFSALNANECHSCKYQVDHNSLGEYFKTMKKISPSSSFITVYTTLPNKRTARTLAKTLLSEGLVACVNCFNHVDSLYWWEGKVCEEKEIVVLLKTSRLLFKKLEKRLITLHPYKTPCIYSLRWLHTGMDYKQWLKRELASQSLR